MAIEIKMIVAISENIRMRHYKSEDRRVSSQQCQELEIQERHHIQQRQK